LWLKGGLRLEDNGNVKYWDMATDSAGGLNLKDGGGDNRLVLLSGGNVGIGIDSPSYKLDVAGTLHTSAGNNVSIGEDGAGEQSILLYSDTAGRYLNLKHYGNYAQAHWGNTHYQETWDYKTFKHITVGDLGRWTSTGLGIGTTSVSAKLQVAGDVKFADTLNNVHLTIQETGTNSALISGASSAGLYLTTDSGTRIELTGNKIIQTGRVTSSMTSANAGAVNTATDGGSFYEVEAIGNEGQVATTLTTTLTLPDGAVGGERYTVSCTAAGSYRPPGGPTLTGTCIISGTLVNGTAGLPAASMTGATAAGLGNVQQALYEFIWVPGTVGGMGGWMYTSKVYT
jgi:hypothetical protein